LVASFEVVETDRQIEAGMAASKQPRRFLDFKVDGRPLYPEIRRRGHDFITGLWLDDAVARAAAVVAVRRLLGVEPPDAPHNRVSVYVCAECGDLGCGAITVDVGKSDAAVSWRDWGYQTNYDDEVHPLGLHDLPDVTFDRAEYEVALRDALKRIGPD
jgi:hypothetical protein